MAPFHSNQAKTRSNTSKVRQNSNFQIPLCLLVPIVHRMSKHWASVTNTQTTGNPHNTAGRQLKFTPEVALKGTHSAVKFNCQIHPLLQGINHFIHDNHPHSVPLCGKFESALDSPFANFEN